MARREDGGEKDDLICETRANTEARHLVPRAMEGVGRV